MKPFVIAVVSLLAASCSDPGRPSQEPAFSQSLEDGALRLSLSLDAATITAAESLVLTIGIQYPEDARLAVTPFGEKFGEFLVETNELEPVRLVSNDDLFVTRSITLAPLTSGEMLLPSIAVEATRTEGRTLSVRSPEIPVVVTSLFGENNPTQLHDIEGPLDAPIPLAWKLGGAAFLLASVAGLIWLRRQRRQEAPPPTKAPIPPGEAALARLDALSAGDLLSKGRYKQFHFELSRILREYIEQRFSIRAQEQTTQEFLSELRSDGVFSPAHQQLLWDFLLLADLIKFAEHESGIEQSQRAAETCRRFVVETDAAHPEPTMEMTLR